MQKHAMVITRPALASLSLLVHAKVFFIHIPGLLNVQVKDTALGIIEIIREVESLELNRR